MINNRKHIAFNEDVYWGGKIQFIEGLGPNQSFLYAWGSGMLHPYVVCQFQEAEKVYSIENYYFKDCDLIYDNVDSYSAEDIKFYPNPVKDYLNIQYSNPNFPEGTCIDLYDINGKCMLSEDMSSKIFVGDLLSGIYIVTIQTTEGKYNFKFIKE